MKISILIPTRLRSTRLAKLIDNIYETCKYKNEIEVLFLIEESDEESIKFSQECVKANVKWYRCNRAADNIIYSNLANSLYKHATGDIILLGADDILFHCQNWDSLVIDYFDNCPDKILLLGPKDGIQNGVLAPHFFLHRNWIDTLGYVQPPYFNAFVSKNTQLILDDRPIN